LGLELIALSPGIPFQEEWAPAFHRALASVSGTAPETEDKAADKTEPDNDLLATAVAALEASGADQFSATLEAIAGDETLDTSLRFDAAKALLVPKRPIASAAFALCEATLQPGGESAFRPQAVALLVGATLGAAERDRLAPLLARFGPVEWSSFPNLFRK